MRIILIALLISSCGSGDGEIHQCLTREEAIVKCQAEEIEKGVTAKEARRYCENFYTEEGCY